MAQGAGGAAVVIQRPESLSESCGGSEGSSFWKNLEQKKEIVQRMEDIDNIIPSWPIQ